MILRIVPEINSDILTIGGPVPCARSGAVVNGNLDNEPRTP